MSSREKLTAFFNAHKEHMENAYPGINRRIFLNYFESVLSKGFISPIELKPYLSKIKQGIPLEYILGRAFFYELEFEINEYALIPRFETDILVEQAIQYIKNNEVNSVLDLGTGPGTILLNLAFACPELKDLVGSDIDENVLSLARRNHYLKKFRFSPTQKISFIRSDRFENIKQTFDLIVSNPPYIKREAHNALVHSKTHQFEPHLALYLDDVDYYQWFDVLFQDVYEHLHDNGLFLMEGHEDELDQLAQNAKQLFSQVRIIKDLSERNRILGLRK